MFALIPVLSFVGTKIFNSPFDKNSKKYPRIYFSNGSREEWGGNVLVLAELVIFSLIKKDFFAAGAAFAGLVFGGIGFTVGLLLYDFNERRHNGRYFFGRWQEKRMIDGWKIMEHSFGAIGGGGVMLWFCLNNAYFSELCRKASSSGVIKDGTAADTVCAVLVTVLLLITAVQYLVNAVCLKKTGKEPDIHIFELLERPLFSAVPLIFVFFGFYRASCAVSLLTLLYALCEKCGFEWFSEYKNKNVVLAVYAAVFIGFSAYFYTTFRISALLLMLVYTFGYTASVLYKSYQKENRAKRKESGKSVTEFYKSRLTVDMHMVVQCIVLVAVTAFLL